MLDVSTDAVIKARIDVSFVLVVDPPWRFRFTSNLKSRNLLRQLNQLPIMMRSKESLPCCWIFITSSSPQRSRLLKENWAEIACTDRFFLSSVVVLTCNNDSSNAIQHANFACFYWVSLVDQKYLLSSSKISFIFMVWIQPLCYGPLTGATDRGHLPLQERSRGNGRNAQSFRRFTLPQSAWTPYLSLPQTCFKSVNWNIPESNCLFFYFANPWCLSDPRVCSSRSMSFYINLSKGLT